MINPYYETSLTKQNDCCEKKIMDSSIIDFVFDYTVCSKQYFITMIDIIF